MEESLIVQVRDILISVYLVVGIVVMIALLVLLYTWVKVARRLFSAMTETVEKVNGTLNSVGRVSETAMQFMRSPSGDAGGASFANGLGMLIGFVAGLRGKTK